MLECPFFGLCVRVNVDVQILEFFLISWWVEWFHDDSAPTKGCCLSGLHQALTVPHPFLLESALKDKCTLAV